jgi:hypothetical protein
MPAQPHFGTVATSWPARSRANRPIDALVEQDFHLVAAASMHSFAPSRNAMTCSRCTLGKPSRKSFAAFEIIDQILDGHSRAGKARRATHYFRINFDD